MRGGASDRASLFMTLGTTVAAVAQALAARTGMKIVTNSLEVARILAPRADMEVVVAGGHVQRHNGGVVGASAVEFVSHYKCDVMVTGIGAIDSDGTLLEFHEAEVAVAQAMLVNARRVLVAADHSKFRRTANYRLASLKDVDAVYTDAAVDRATGARARIAGARIVVTTSGARLLLNNHPWSQAMREMAADFTARTGIRTRIEIFNEEQFRARLTTLMQGRSADVDVFMSLPSREGAVFKRAGWYTDLAPMIADRRLTAPDFNYEDFGAGMRQQATIDGLVATLPINQEGPLFYWRRDIFQRCNIPEPRFLEDIPEAAARIRACDANQGVWAARGLRGAINYAHVGLRLQHGRQLRDAGRPPRPVPARDDPRHRDVRQPAEGLRPARRAEPHLHPGDRAARPGPHRHDA
jgi:hypothetical protein